MSRIVSSDLSGNILSFNTESANIFNNSNIHLQPIYATFTNPGDYEPQENIDCIGFQIVKKSINVDTSTPQTNWTDLYTNNIFIKGNITSATHAITKEYFENNMFTSSGSSSSSITVLPIGVNGYTSSVSNDLYTFTKTNNSVIFDQSNISSGDIIISNPYTSFQQSFVVTTLNNTASIPNGNIITSRKYTGTIASQDYDNANITGGNVTHLYDLSAAIDLSGNPRFFVQGNTGFCTAVNFTASSDRRLKENISDIEDPLLLINKMNGKKFHWKNESQLHPSYGFIAQELEENFPSLVINGLNGYKSVDYDKISSILVESVKTLYNEIVTMKQEIKNLKESKI